MTPGPLRRLARRIVPRTVRNRVRSPRATAQWAWQEAGYYLGRRPACRLRPDWVARCHPASLPTFGLFQQEEFRHELDGFVARCTPGLVLLDIGAHYGAFTLAALRHGGPHARVIAVDPSRQSNRVLRVNLRLAGAGDRVQVIEGAVGAEDGHLSMLTTGPAGEHFLVASAAPRPDAVRRPQWTIPSLIARAGATPTHIKIDVEGFEEEVLRGGLDFLRRARPILFLELHGAMLRGRGRRPEEVLGLLSACGYDRLQWHGRPIAPAEAAALETARLVCLPRIGEVAQD
jgi:FkbM family methyltransferase